MCPNNKASFPAAYRMACLVKSLITSPSALSNTPISTLRQKFPSRTSTSGRLHKVVAAMALDHTRSEKSNLGLTVGGPPFPKAT